MCYQHAHRYFNAQAIRMYYKEEDGGLGRMSQEWQCLEPQAFQAWAGDGVAALLHPALLPPPTAGVLSPYGVLITSRSHCPFTSSSSGCSVI